MTNGTLGNLLKGLTLYYQLIGADFKADDGDTDKFTAWMEENGFTEEDFEEEFEGDPQDASLIEFDMDDDDENNIFPLETSIQTETERNAAIFKIMKYCYINGSPPLYRKAHEIKINEEVITSKIIDQSNEEYKEQTPSVFETVKSEQDVKRFLAARKVNNDFPFLQYMVDSFTRDRILYNFDEKEAPEITNWVQKMKQKDPDSFVAHLENQYSPKLLETLTNGIKGYCHRICPLMQFKPLTKIDDSIESISNYLISVTQFIKRLIAEEKAVPPFQVDLSIAVKNTMRDSKMQNPMFGDDDDDDDDYGNDDDDAAVDNTDYIGNIHDKLKHENCSFYKETINEEKEGDAMARDMMNYYKKFRDELHEHPKKKVKDPHNHHIDFDAASYPHKKRFQIMVDRRQQKDEITFFEPPSVCDTIPAGKHVPEWYFDSAGKCLIPRKGFGDGSDEKDKNDDKDEKQQEITITSKEGVAGKLMTFSFQVEAADQIRCYLYWMGQTIRFYPQDIACVFKFVFQDFKYSNWMQGKKHEQFIEKIHITDPQFENFYQSLKKKHYYQFPKKKDLIDPNKYAKFQMLLQ